MADTIDPRIARTKTLVLAAARDLVASVGYGRTTIEGIAERSGVARSTIYRHWPDRSQLLIDALQEEAPPFELAAGPDLRTDLRAIMANLASRLSQPQISKLLTALLDAATRDPELATLHSRFTMARRRPALIALRRAMDRGEIRPDTDIDEIATLLVSPLFFRRFFTHESLDNEFIDRHIERVLREISVNQPDEATTSSS